MKNKDPSTGESWGLLSRDDAVPGTNQAQPKPTTVSMISNLYPGFGCVMPSDTEHGTFCERKELSRYGKVLSGGNAP
jgi:hypothetical protein